MAFFAFAALTTFACSDDVEEEKLAGTDTEDARGGDTSDGGVSDAERAGFGRHDDDDDLIEQGIKNFLKPIPTGNGRACATCHVPDKNFTISPAEADARFKKNPKDPLFWSIDADDFANNFNTVRTKALFRVTIPLPPNVKLASNPAAKDVKLFRAVPTIFNVKLTAPFTHDGREASLTSQARGAALEHSRPSAVPGNSFFAAIAAAQEKAFSSPAVKNASDLLDAGQTPPPPGQDYDKPLNALEQQGFAAFQEHCLVCHDGNGRSRINTAVFPSGFFTAFVSERNRANLPVIDFDVTDPATGAVTRVSSPDPGRMLITGKLADKNFFDATQLRGISKTAPYFHDNSSPNLRDALEHYNVLFTAFGIPTIRPEQFDPLLAYLNRL